jgi:hypothetical protein
MNFKDELLKLSLKVAEQKDRIMTEEATKTAFVLPFIQILGYDIFNPCEVEPEHTCDVGTKKGEKIDYAIKRGGKPVLLVECKHWKENLDIHGNQLFRYYVVSEARFAILTNGVRYRFFSDLERQNVMDKVPFLEFDITDVNEWYIGQLMKFRKPYFNEQYIHDTIPSIKYISETIAYFVAEIKDFQDDRESLVIMYEQELREASVRETRTEREFERQSERSMQKIKELEETLRALKDAERVSEEAAADAERAHKSKSDDLGDLIDYLNMPVPDDWYKMSLFERMTYYKDQKDAWRGSPRDSVCTTEVAREFFELPRSECSPSRGRKIGEAIRQTGLFTQDGSKKKFGEYGIAVAWVRKTSIVNAIKYKKRIMYHR